MKAHEERSGAGSIKAPVVIENANLQTVMFLSWKRRMTRIAAYRVPVKLLPQKNPLAVRQWAQDDGQG
jgi:hypothetical protein